MRSGTEEGERHEEAEGLQEAEKRKNKLRDCRRRVKDFLNSHPDGETLTSIRKAVGIDGKLLRKVLDGMINKGTLKPTSVAKRAGNAGTRNHRGFKLTRRKKRSPKVTQIRDE